MRLYFATVNWFDSCKDDDNTNKVFVFGESISAAAANIEESFSDVQSVTIEEVQFDCGVPILYVPDDDELIQKITEENIY